MNVNKAIQLALENHEAGNLQQAELIYRNILKNDQMTLMHCTYLESYTINWGTMILR